MMRRPDRRDSDALVQPDTPGKTAVSMLLDDDILAQLIKNAGPGWETRCENLVNEILRAFVSKL